MSGVFTFTNGSAYGAFELKRLYPKYYCIGLMTAVTIHFLVLIIYFIFGVERNSITSNVTPSIRIIEWENFEAPSLEKYISKDGAQVSTAKLKDGVPVPTSNKLAEPDATIPSTIERRNHNSTIELLKDNEIIEIKGMPEDAVTPSQKLPGINDLVIAEELPVMVVAPIPEYPSVAVKAGISGTVLVKILIDKAGKVIRAVVIKSDSELLNQAAIDAALNSSFIPALQNNSPVAVWIVLPYRFKLRDK